MALRDTWHNVLVYFGLAEEDDGYRDEPEPEPEEEIQAGYRERPNVRRLQSRRRRDEIDDIFADEAPRSSSRPTRVLRPVDGNGGRGGGGVPGHLGIPKSFHDAQQGADPFKDAPPGVLKLPGTDTERSERPSDFAPGPTAPLYGGP